MKDGVAQGGRPTGNQSRGSPNILRSCPGPFPSVPLALPEEILPEMEGNLGPCSQGRAAGPEMNVAFVP